MGVIRVADRICARTGRVGQAHTDLFVPSTICLLSYRDQSSKPQSLELPPNAERKRLVSPQGRRNEQR